MFRVSRHYTFEAAHSLPHLPPDHKCHRTHGHGYRVTVHVSADQLDERGFVVEYADLDAVVDPLIEELDHRNINDVLGVPTTAENLAKWIGVRVLGALGMRVRVDVRETPRAVATWES